MGDFAVPEYVLRALKYLEANNFEAYLVGGCVRDMLMGIVPHDYDITTNALPGQVIKCFSQFRVIETGIKHGTVTVIIDGNQIEITTYRVDGSYSDNRRPDNVSFSQSLENDLSRRDFTMNAIAYNPSLGIVDPFNGREDIKNKTIVCVGKADKRFKEDSLRILRAMRFAARLGFKVEGKTALAADENALLLNNISKERIYAELLRILEADFPAAVLYRFKKQLFVIVHELEDLSSNDLSAVFEAIDRSENDKFIRLSILFWHLGASVAKEVLLRLKADRHTIETVCLLIKNGSISIETNEIFAKRLLRELPYENILRLIGFLSAIKFECVYELEKLSKMVDTVYIRGDCTSVSALAIGGTQLIEENIASGAEIGVMLNRLLDLVIEGTLKNEKDTLIDAAKKLRQ